MADTTAASCTSTASHDQQPQRSSSTDTTTTSDDAPTGTPLPATIIPSSSSSAGNGTLDREVGDQCVTASASCSSSVVLGANTTTTTTTTVEGGPIITSLEPQSMIPDNGDDDSNAIRIPTDDDDDTAPLSNGTANKIEEIAVGTNDDIAEAAAASSTSSALPVDTTATVVARSPPKDSTGTVPSSSSSSFTSNDTAAAASPPVVSMENDNAPTLPPSPSTTVEVPDLLSMSSAEPPPVMAPSPALLSPMEPTAPAAQSNVPDLLSLEPPPTVVTAPETTTALSTHAAPIHTPAPPTATSQEQKRILELQAQVQSLQESHTAQLQHVTAERDAIQSQCNALQSKLDHELTARAEAEHKARSAYDRVKTLEDEKQANLATLQEYQTTIKQTESAHSKLEQDVLRLRQERDTHQQQRLSLAARLNTALKHEASKVNLSEHYEHDLQRATDDLFVTRQALQTLTDTHNHTSAQLAYTQQTVTDLEQYAQHVRDHARTSRRTRATKMRTFVHAKTEEVRQAVDDAASLRAELTHLHQSTAALTAQYQQTHQQWVTAQARNRELQRDVQKLRTTTTTSGAEQQQQRKQQTAAAASSDEQKRRAARQELLQVVQTLEQERAAVAELQSRVQFVLPTVRDAHQAVQKEMDTVTQGILPQLSLGLGQTVPEGDAVETNGQHPAATTVLPSASSDTTTHHKGPHTEFQSIVERMEHESQSLRTSLTRLSDAIDQVRRIAAIASSHPTSGSHHRSCMSVISELVLTGSMATSPALQQAVPRLGYGHVPNGAAASSSPSPSSAP